MGSRDIFGKMLSDVDEEQEFANHKTRERGTKKEEQKETVSESKHEVASVAPVVETKQPAEYIEQEIPKKKKVGRPRLGQKREGNAISVYFPDEVRVFLLDSCKARGIPVSRYIMDLTVRDLAEHKEEYERQITLRKKFIP